MDEPRDSRFFTRHLFRAGLECPVKLYYKAHNYPENTGSLPFIEHVRFNRRLLIGLARCSFPDGILIEEPGAEEAFDATRKLLRRKEVALFKPVFIWNHFKATLPILKKTGRRVDVYQVQTKAFDKHKHTLTDQYGSLRGKWSDYIHDLAFQVHVISRLHPSWDIRPFLVLPDKTARSRNSDLPAKISKILEHPEERHPERQECLEEELLAIIDVQSEVRGLLAPGGSPRSFEEQSFEEVLDRLSGIYLSGEKPPVEVGAKCKTCEFRLEENTGSAAQSGFGECWGEAARDHVFDLIGPGTRGMVERGVYRREEVPGAELVPLETITGEESRLTEVHRQSLQVMKAKGEHVPEEIIKRPLAREAGSWNYPIHFLDFEAGNYVLPVKPGRKPYSLLVFQYSCHTLREDGSVTHHEWIQHPFEERYANYELVRNLMQVPGMLEGTLVEYSNFERNALKGIRQELREEGEPVADAPELLEWIGRVLGGGQGGLHLSDMSRLVKNYYYNRCMENSLSIKDVLSAVMTVSPVLKEHYARPYSSSNFDDITWWQWDEARERTRNPYDILQEQQDRFGVRRGTEAMVEYGRLMVDAAGREEYGVIKDALLKYCELDTLAMLMIYLHWKERIGDQGTCNKDY